MNFSRGVGGSLSHLWNSEGVGGHQIPAKMENPGRWGVLSEIPSMVGVWILMELHNSGHVMFSRELIWLLLFS